MGQLSTSFADSTYTSSNKPSCDTLKSDIGAIETAHNETDTYSIRSDGTVAFSAAQSMGGNKLTGLATPTISTDAATMGYAQSLYPVGSIYMNSSVATNPGTLFGFGTWTAFGAGKMLVGLNSADTDFDTAGETGGAKTVTVATANLPNISVGAGTAHTHVQDAHTHNVKLYYGSATGARNQSYAVNETSNTGNELTDATTATNQNESSHTHSLGGSGTALNVMNPYITVYMWTRTA